VLLGVLVRTEGSLPRAPPPPPPPHAPHRTARPSRHDAPRVAGISPSRALFLQSGKNGLDGRVTVSQFGSLPDRGLL
jgi:hypothetical protein